MQVTRLIQLIVLSVFLVGCASTAERMREKGVEPMTAEELRATLPGNTTYQKGDGWEDALYYTPDGTVRGWSWWNGGEEKATATYEITDEGLLCRDWDNDWGGGGYYCVRMYRDGESIVYDHVSGSKGNILTGTLTVLKGNKYNL